ncbi:hypothetical protein [Kineococcus sp. NPDC059986]|uniref:hypothetical protein n=1 Tax=Kineococcus sp. NPDC059986 TaxID=3155538 RepID=UPI00344F4D2B
MAAKVIPDQEVERLIKAGLNQGEIVDYLREKHHIQVTRKAISLWSRRRGMPRQRPATPVDIIPWKIEPQHRHKQILTLLRTEAKVRRGDPVPPRLASTYPRWREMLRTEGLVVDYKPESEEGFVYVPRRKSDGDALVRMPKDITAAPRWEG